MLIRFTRLTKVTHSLGMGMLPIWDKPLPWQSDFQVRPKELDYVWRPSPDKEQVLAVCLKIRDGESRFGVELVLPASGR
jgi:hypothetical protein